MKKAFTSLSALTLALALCLSLCACGPKQAHIPTEAPTQAPTEVTQEPSEEVTQATTEATTKATKPATKATLATKATKATQAPTTKATQAPTTKATKATLATKATKATVASTTKATVAPTTKATEAPAANFKTLTYSGTGYQMLTDIYIPEGRYIVSGIGSSTDGSAGSFYMHLYDENDRLIAYWNESVFSTKQTIEKSKSFKGSISGGLLEIDADQNVTWSVTISLPGATDAKPTLPTTNPTNSSESTSGNGTEKWNKSALDEVYDNIIHAYGYVLYAEGEVTQANAALSANNSALAQTLMNFAGATLGDAKNILFEALSTAKAGPEIRLQSGGEYDTLVEILQAAYDTIKSVAGTSGTNVTMPPAIATFKTLYDVIADELIWPQ